MFSGIVLETGTVVSLTKRQNLAVLQIKVNKIGKDTAVGDSVCVSGVCLTVTGIRGRTIVFDMMKETLAATTLGSLRAGDHVNLELAIKGDGRFGGHFVTGHVDGIGVIRKIVTLENYVEWQIMAPHDLRRFIAAKGSITIDGISLTVGAVRAKDFLVYLIPFTLSETTAGQKIKGSRVNIEVDILARYVLNKKRS